MNSSETQETLNEVRSLETNTFWLNIAIGTMGKNLVIVLN